jgi:hypothetical protein
VKLSEDKVRTMQKSKLIKLGQIAIICGTLLAGCGQPSTSEKTQEAPPVMTPRTDQEILSGTDITSTVRNFAAKTIEKMYKYDGDVFYASKSVSIPKSIGKNKWTVDVVGSKIIRSGEIKNHHLKLTIKSFETELGERGFKNFKSRLQIIEIKK